MKGQNFPKHTHNYIYNAILINLQKGKRFMKKKTWFKKITSMVVAFGMVIALTPSSVFADDILTEEAQTEITTEAEETTEAEITTEEMVIPEEVTTEETTEAVTETPEVTSEEEEVTTEEVTTEETTEVEESENEEEAEETSAEVIPTFTQVYDGVDVSGKDFSSCELLIATGDASIFTADTEVVSEYNGIYLTRYPDATTTMYAYSYYYNKVELIEVNSVNFKGADNEAENETEETSEDDGDVPQQESEETDPVDNTEDSAPAEEIANDGHGEADLSNLNNGNDAFSNVSDLGAVYGADIALIDTGASGSNVVGAVSVLGGGTGDDNGHGTKMYNAIINQNPNARILSIKALDSSNRGQASDIYAAIQYAIDSNVRIINLSLASISSSDSQIVVDAINEAIGNGITVVGAAGNYSSNASYFIPGCVGGVITCAATDSDGNLLSTSNYGSAVDYYVVADSTSEAAAIVSGLISKDGLGFSSDIVRTEEGQNKETASEGDAIEIVVEKEEERTPEEREETEKQTDLDRNILEDNPWLNHGQFLGQINPDGGSYSPATPPAGYPSIIMANCSAIVEVDHADANHRIGTVLATDVYSMNNGCNINDFVYDKPVSLYCNCDYEGISSIYHHYWNTAGGTEHFSGPAGPQHLCTVPGSGEISIPATAFIYSGTSVTIGGQTYYRYFTVDYASGYSGAGYQDVRMIMDIRRNSSPGYVTIHKSGKTQSGATSTKSLDGIKYGLYRNLTGTEEKLAEFTLGSDGWPRTGNGGRNGINVVGSSAGTGDGPTIRSDGHAYLQWYSTTSPQNWYFREISTNGNYFLNSSNITAQYNNNNAVKVAEVTDYEITGQIEVFKYVQGSASKTGLASAKFTVYNSSGSSAGTITTNSEGYGRLQGLYPGTYTIKETTAPSHYVANNQTWTFTIAANGAASYPSQSSITTAHGWAAGLGNNTSLSPHLAVPNVTTPKKVKVKKVSSNPDYTNRNDNYSLAGAEFAIYKDPNVAQAEIDAGDYSHALTTLTTGANGESPIFTIDQSLMNKTNAGVVIPTKFYAVETKAPKNYQMNRGPHEVTVTAANDTDANAAVFNISDVPVNDPINVYIEKNHNSTEDAQGNKAALLNAEFTVKHYPLDIEENYTFEELQSFTPDITETYTTQELADGKIGIKIDKFYPLGYLTIEETTPPEGFVINPTDKAFINGNEVSAKMAFVLISDGTPETGYHGIGSYYVDENGNRDDYIAHDVTVTNTFNLNNELGRADIKWVKEDQNGNPVPIGEAQFEIKNNETKETAIVTTDEYGNFSTEASFESHTTGVWFKLGKQNTVEETPDDNKGALPLGEYTITEIKAPTGMQKEEPITVTLDTDGEVVTIFDNARGDQREVISDMDEASLGTLALVETSNGETKTLPAAPGQTIHDICEWKNLRYDSDYTLVGKLVQINKDGTTEFVKTTDDQGNEVEATGITHFRTPDTYTQSRYDACGESEIEFSNLDFTGKEGLNFVVFERLYLGDLTEDDIKNENYDKEYPDSNNDTEFPLLHEDETDKDQTVTVPDGQTEAEYEDGTKTASVLKSKHFVINDTVSYTGLTVGRHYRLEGQLYVRPANDSDDKEYTDAELEELKALDKDGNEIKSSTTFVPTERDGVAVVTFEYDMDYEVEKRTYVVFEDCYDEDDGDIRVFHHGNIHDDGQSSYEPVISTQAKGTEERSELCYKEGKFVDTIFYENLEANATYIVNGIAIDKETGEPILLNGKKVAAQAEFTTGEATNQNGAVDGSYDLEFNITEDQYNDLEGKTFVIYESLQNEALSLIAQHNDINDLGQQLTVSKLETELLGEDTKDHITYPDEEVVLIDTCQYSNLIGGKNYSISGKLMNQATGEPLLDENGKEITGKTDFIADESGNGVVEVKFTFNAKILHIEGESIVAFEEVRPQGYELPIAVHTEIDDESQTVDICKVGTKVSKSDWTTKDTISLTDSISYKNLYIADGYKYIAKGWLVDEKGEKITVDGKEIYKEVEFTPTAKDGMIDVKFDDFSAAGLNGKYVVFEEVYVVIPEHTDKDGKKITSSTHLIGEHKDLTDSNQTITVSHTPKTGMTVFFIILGILAVGGAGMLIFRRKNVISK